MCTRNPYNHAEVHMIRCRTVMNWTHYTIRATVYSLGKAIKYVLWIVFLVLAGKCIAVLYVLSEHIEFVWRIPPSIGGAFVHEWHVWHACFFLFVLRSRRKALTHTATTNTTLCRFFLFWQRNSSQWRQMDTFNAINLKLNNLFNFFWFYFNSETLIQSFIYKIGVSMINIFKCKTCICSAVNYSHMTIIRSFFFWQKMYHNNIIFRNTTHF